MKRFNLEELALAQVPRLIFAVRARRSSRTDNSLHPMCIVAMARTARGLDPGPRVEQGPRTVRSPVCRYKTDGLASLSATPAKETQCERATSPTRATTPPTSRGC